MRRLLVAALVVGGCAHEAPRPAPAPPPVVERAPPRAEAPDEMKVSGTLGTLDEDEIAGPFQRRWDDITRCYDDVARQQQFLGGKIEVKLRITHAGDPKSAYVVSSTFGNYDAERCVVAIARELHFAKPKGGGE